MFVMLPRSPAESTLAPRDAVPGGARPRTAPGRRGSDRAENESVVDDCGLVPEPLGEEWPQFAHPTRPEFLLTRPDLHGTAGFFIARLSAS